MALGMYTSLEKSGMRARGSRPPDSLKIEDKVSDEEAYHPKHAPTSALHRRASALKSSTEEVACTTITPLNFRPVQDC